MTEAQRELYDKVNKWVSMEFNFHFIDNYFAAGEDEIFDFFVPVDGDDDNYPGWNTVFEARDPSLELEAAAIWLGIGVIRANPYFGTTLFFKSAGHSFFGRYWIPLYLELYPDEKEKYKGVDFSSL